MTTPTKNNNLEPWIANLPSGFVDPFKSQEIDNLPPDFVDPFEKDIAAPTSDPGVAKARAALNGEPPSRGFFGDVASGLARGGVNLMESAGHILKYADSPGGIDVARNIGEALTKKAKSWTEESPFLQPSKKEKESYLRRAVTGTLESAPLSLGPSLGGAAAGAAIGSVVPGVGTVIGGLAGGALSTLGAFYASSFNKTYEDAIKAGKSKEEAETLGRKIGLIEGGIEFVTTPFELMTAGFGKVATQPLKSTVKQILKTPAKQFLKDFAKTAGIETGTEGLQNYWEASVLQNAGMETPPPLEALVESIGPSLGMTVLFTMGAHGLNRRRTNNLRETLADPEADISQRKQAAIEVGGYIQENQKDPALTREWLRKANTAITEKQPIPIDEDIREWATMKLEAETTQETTPETTLGQAKDVVTPSLTEEERAMIPADLVVEPEGEKGQGSGVPVSGPNGLKASLTPAPVNLIKKEDDKLYQAKPEEFLKAKTLAQEGAGLGAIFNGLRPDGSAQFTDRETGKAFVALPGQVEEELRKLQGAGFETQSEGQIKPYTFETAKPSTPEKISSPTTSGIKGAAAEASAIPNVEAGPEIKLKVRTSPGKQGVTRLTYYKDGHIVGNARLMGGTIGDVWVNKNVRRQGIGTAMVKDLVERGGNAANTVNEASRGLFVKAGFVEDRPDHFVRQTEGKNPWEIQKNEYVNSQPIDIKQGFTKEFWAGYHQSQVDRAASQSLPVPSEVLKDYPDIKIKVQEASRVETVQEINAKAQEAATSSQNALPQPTQAQKEAGNYQKGHVDIQGLDISIENPKGSERSGTDRSGKPWSITMQQHYGYIKGTVGRDKDHIDTFIGDRPESQQVFVVNQVDPGSGKFDEHKVMLGFETEEEARSAYLANYQKGWKGLGSMVPMSLEEFKGWIKEGDTKREVRSEEFGVRSETPEMAKPSEAPGSTISTENPKKEAEKGDLPVRLTPKTPFGLRLRDLFDQKQTKEIDRELKKASDQEIEAAYNDKGLIAPLSSLVAQERAEREILTNVSNPEKPQEAPGSTISKAIETPAPEKEPAKAPAKPLEKMAFGSETNVSTPKTTKVPVQYALVDIKDLVTSHDNALNLNPDYPQELQPRNRTRLAPEEQIGRIVNMLDPALLGETPMAQYGAPIVTDAGIVLSGNARTIALRRILRDHPEQAEKYREWLKANAERFGLDPKAIGDNSVLVRVNRSKMDLTRLARESNEEAIASMSPSEQAMNDAGKLTAAHLDHFAPSDEGNLLAAPNREFIRLFMRDVVSPNEVNALTTRDGELSQAGVNRIRNAVFAKAYGDAETLERLAESTDNNVRNITNGMLAASSKLMKVRAGIEEGRFYPVDIAKDIVAAMKKLSEIRNRGITLEDYIRQPEMFDTMTPEAKNLLGILGQYSRSAKKIGEFLNIYAGMAMATPKNEGQASLFKNLGPKVEPTVNELIEYTKRKMEALYGPEKATTQFDIFHGKPTGSRQGATGELSAVRKQGEAGEVEAEKKPAAAQKIEINTEDAGIELAYNKRNRIKTGIKWEDIADDNAALKVKQTTKQNVYPRPDYAQMIESGQEPMIAHLVKQVYDSIPTRPTTRQAPTDADLKLYIQAVNRVMAGTLAWSNNTESVGAWATSQAKIAGAMLGKQTSISELGGRYKTLLDTVYPEGWKNYKDEVRILGGNKILRALQPGYDEGKRAVGAVKEGWPAKQESWQKQGYSVVESGKAATIKEGYSYGKDSSEKIPVFTVALNNRSFESFPSREEAEKAKVNLKEWLLLDKYSRLKGQFDTEAEAIEAAREQVKRESKTQISDRGISIKSAERIGEARRLPDEDITSDRLQETFGFKGVNFGNWMKGESNKAERQLHLNHAYDSLMDLADILGVPHKALSLNGMLGLAIGAQGSGKNAAHFVPGVNEINITRTSGAGSLAHEFAHAVDHYFAGQAGLASSKEPFLSEHTGGIDAEGYTKQAGKKVKAFGEGIRLEIAGLFKNIVLAINKRQPSKAEVAARINEAKDKAQGRVEGWLKHIRKDFAGQEEDFDKLAGRIMDLDLGEGKISIGGASYLSPVVSEMRDLYKKENGRVYSVDNLKGLQVNIDAYSYLNSEKAAVQEHIPQLVNTDYSKNALTLDQEKGGKPYWSQNLEKFARAFDAYVSDTLEARALKNSYLSHAGRSGETVPAGKERTAINEAFGKLFEEIKTRETETGGTAMFALKRAAKEENPTIEAKFIGLQENLPGRQPLPLVNVPLENRSGETTVVYDPARHILSNPKEYEKALGEGNVRFALNEKVQTPIEAKGAGLTTDQVTKAIGPISEKIRQGVEVVGGVEELPENIRKSLTPGGVPEGVFDPGTGKIFLVAKNLTDADHVQRILAHELIGHLGVRGVLGDRFRPVMNRIFIAYGPARMEAIAKDYGLDLTRAEDKQLAAEEMIARMAETGEKPGILKEIFAAIRGALRRMGFDLKWTDADIQRLLAQARKMVDGRFTFADQTGEVASLALKNGTDLTNQTLPAPSRNLYAPLNDLRKTLSSPDMIFTGIDDVAPLFKSKLDQAKQTVRSIIQEAEKLKDLAISSEERSFIQDKIDELSGVLEDAALGNYREAFDSHDENYQGRLNEALADRDDTLDEIKRNREAHLAQTMPEDFEVAQNYYDEVARIRKEFDQEARQAHLNQGKTNQVAARDYLNDLRTLDQDLLDDLQYWLDDFSRAVQDSLKDIGPEVRFARSRTDLDQVKVDKELKNFDQHSLSDYIEIGGNMIKYWGKAQVQGRPDTSIAGRFLGSPEFTFEDVPALKRTVTANIERTDLRNAKFNGLTTNDSGKDLTAGLLKFSNDRPAEFKRLANVLIRADQNQDKTINADKLEAMGFSDQAIAAALDFRAVVYKGADLQISKWRAMVQEAQELGLPEPEFIITDELGKPKEVSLQVAVAKMNEVREYYYPRNHGSGEWQIVAIATPEMKAQGIHNRLEFRDTKFFTEKRKVELEREGFRVQYEKSKGLSEDLFAIWGKTMGTEQFINEALERTNRELEKNQKFQLSDLGIRAEWGKAKSGKPDFILDTTDMVQNRQRSIIEAFKKAGGKWYAAEEGGPKAWHFVDADKDIETKLKNELAIYDDRLRIVQTEFARSLAMQAANLERIRGSRRSMVNRGPEVGIDVWEGYETNPAKAIIAYAQGLAAGMAKAETALKMIKAFNGTDISFEQYQKENPGTKFEDYKKFVDARRVSPNLQKNAYYDGLTYIKEALRNSETVDRVVGVAKGLVNFKYLGFRVAAPIVNLTSLITSVPAAMNGYAGIPLGQTFKWLGRGADLWWQYRHPGTWSSLPAETQAAFRIIREKGWAESQYNKEALEVLKTKIGQGWTRLMDWSMFMFGQTEQLNRVATLMGTFAAIREREGGSQKRGVLSSNEQAAVEKAMETAKRVSDRAHGIYGPATLPAIAQGKGPAAMVIKSLYMFKKFQHNYLQTMYELGWKQKNWQAATFMMVAPTLLAGALAFPVPLVREAIMGIFKHLFGVDDPEEKFYSAMEHTLGDYIGGIPRQGLARLAGMDLRGSMGMGKIDIPDNMIELLGAPGSVLVDVYQGGANILKGNVWKGTEKVLPRAGGTVLQGIREATEGLTTKTGAPVFFRKEQIKGDFGDFVLRSLSFNPASIARKREIIWSEKRVGFAYRDRRADINSRFLKFYSLPEADRDKTKMIDLIDQVQEYNARVMSHGLAGVEPRITGESIMAYMMRNFRPKKKELIRERNRPL